MRLFTGIAISAAVTDRLAALLDQVRPKAALQWTPPENFHITTKFLGEWPDDKPNLVIDVLKSVAKPAPFTIQIQELGFFPNAHSPRILWAGVHAPQALTELAHETDRLLHSIGVPLEKHAYTPHVTLARIRSNSSVAAIRDVLVENKIAQFGSIEAVAFHLYLSRAAIGGSSYEKLATFALQ